MPATTSAARDTEVGITVWVAIALAAGCFQTARNGLARSLAGRVSPLLNSWSRFAFNLPFSLLLVAALIAWRGLPDLAPEFYVFCAGTALTQLLGNVALISAFERSNFAQSIVLHKLEVAITAVVGALWFAENPSPLGWLGMGVCAAGVLAMNLGRGDGPRGWRRALHLDAGSLLAFACAVLLVFASFLLKEATASFAESNPYVQSGRFEAAAHTLFHTTWMEVAVLSAALLMLRRKEFSLIARNWKRMAMIGATGFAGSLCWFWAYSLTLVAYVKAVGQIEGVLAVVLALVVWREREVLGQLPGVALICAGIGLVLLG